MLNAYEQYKKLSDDSAAQECYLDACANLMDDDIRENLHGSIDDEAAFLEAYCVAHREQFGEEFIVN